MNLISNCCIGSFLLRNFNFGNTNPFTWATVDFKSLCYLISSYKKINWNNISLSKCPHPDPLLAGKELFEITVDNKVKISYIHFLYDATATSIIVKDVNVYYNKIWDYIIEKYKERIVKMLSINSDPVFVIEWDVNGYDETQLAEFLQIEIPYKTVIITSNQKYKDIKKENLLILYDSSPKTDLTHHGPKFTPPGVIAKKYQNEIKKFFNIS